MYWWEAEAVVRAGSTVIETEDDDIEPMFGVGARYGVTDRFYVGIDWRRYQDVGDSDVDAIGVSFELRQ